MNQLIEQNAQRPDIKRVIMGFVLNHFWSHVFQGSAECIPLLVVVCLNAPSKITNFDYIALLDQNIFRFYVPVDETLFVHEVNTRADLNKKIKGCIFSKVLFLSDEIEEIALACILQGEVDCTLILEACVQSANVFVI